MRAEFVIENLTYRVEPQRISINVSTDLALNETIEDALHRGINLYFLLELSLQRHRFMIWNERISKHGESIVLKYHALSGRYLILDNRGEMRSSFHNIDSALDYIDELGPHDLILPDGFQIQPDANYYVAARIKLNIEALPMPLRPIAYLSSTWRLNSPWILWHIQK